MECEHGWRDAGDCDACTLRRVASQAADRIVELEEALADLAGYAQACASELSDPGVGILCAIHNANQLLRNSTLSR